MNLPSVLVGSKTNLMVISQLTRVHNISCLFFNLLFSVKDKLAKAKKLERIVTQAVHGNKKM